MATLSTTRAAIALVVAACAACSPALDWRTARPDGGAVEMLFPCRPTHDARSVRLDGVETPMRMEACHAAGATFSLTVADAGDAARVAPLIRILRAAAVANIEGQASESALAVPGATPNPLSGRLRIAGRLSDRRAVHEEAAFFVRGTRVYQATVLGESSLIDAADVFFASIKASP